MKKKMRYISMLLMSTALVLGGCGGGANSAASQSAAAEASRHAEEEAAKKAEEEAAAALQAELEEYGIESVEDGVFAEIAALCAAILFFHPDPERYFTGAFIKIGFFGKPGEYGENKYNDVIYHDDIHGPAILQIDKAVDIDKCTAVSKPHA